MLLGYFPYAGVHINTLGEWLWILERRDWPGGCLSTDAQLNEQIEWFTSARRKRPQPANDDILSPLADFRRAIFSGANLDVADLSDTDMREADLSYVRLEHARLGLALMTNVKLERAVLISDQRAQELEDYFRAHEPTGRPYAGVVFTSRQELLFILRERGWEGAPHSYPDHDPAKVTRANLVGADLTQLDLQCADLVGADLTDARLISDARAVELRDAYKQGERPYNGVAVRDANEMVWIFREREWSGAPDGAKDRYAGHFADLRGISLKQAKLAGVYLCYAQFGSAVVEGARLRGARLIGASASSVRFQTVDLRHADLSVLDGNNCNFAGSALIGAKFDAASLESASLYNLNPSEPPIPAMNASFLGANLRAAHLNKIDLRHGTLRVARLHDADLQGANLQGVDMRQVILNAGTVLAGAEGVIQIDSHTWMGGVNWSNGPSIGAIKWEQAWTLGDELLLDDGSRERATTRLDALRVVKMAYTPLALELRRQGVGKAASRYRFRSQQLLQRIARLEKRWLTWIFEAIVDFVVGYGEKPQRTILIYLVMILGFAETYFFWAQVNPAAGPPLSLLNYVVFSVASFHGRGFFPNPRAPDQILVDHFITYLANAEAVLGLFIEITFIAAYTQRLLRD